MSSTLVPIREDGSAIVNYNFDDYSVEVDLNTLSSYPNYSVNSHWHDDLEFTIILSGHLLCNVNGTIHKLEAGQGIFINSRSFHYGFSADSTECTYISVVIHPMLLCGSPHLEHTYVTPFISAKAPSCVLLHDDIPWEAEVQRMVKLIYEYKSSSSAALLIQSIIFQVWRMMYENVFRKHVFPQEDRKRNRSLPC